MAINLFGYTITRGEDVSKLARTQSFVPPTTDDGTATVQGGGYFGTYLEMDATAKSEAELITRYREASMYADCSTAIDEIVTEAIAAVDDEAPVQLNLTGVDLPDNIKKAMQDQFNTIIRLLGFNIKGFDIFRRWYVDGRLYYQKIIDEKNPKRGIIELRQIDPRKIRKVREIKKDKDQKTGVDLIKSIEEFFIYNEKGINYQPNYSTATTGANQGIKIS